MKLFRWIVLLPLSIALSAASYLLIEILSEAAKRFIDGGSVMEAGVVLVASGISGFVFVVSGFVIAPDHRKTAAMLLLAVWVGWALIYCAFYMQYGSRSSSLTDVLAILIAGSLGAWVGYGQYEEMTVKT